MLTPSMENDDDLHDTVDKHLGRLLAAIRGNEFALTNSRAEVDDRDLARTLRDGSAGVSEPNTAVPGVGTVVRGTWELTEQMGKGSFGLVFGAWHRGLERKDAIKFLHPHLADDQELRVRFQREARVMAKLRGARLVQVYDCGEHHGLPFFVMERLDGESLHQRLRRAGPLPLSTFGRLAESILRGLAEVHAHGIIHRDIKPANIFVQQGRHQGLKLLDFGLAMTSMRVTARGVLVGTPLYMAPELLTSSDCSASVATDVYSVGAVLYEMLTGQLPFPLAEGESLADLVRRMALGGVDRPSVLQPGLPPGLDDLLLHALSLDPERRPVSADAFAEALTDVLRATEGTTLVRRAVTPHGDTLPAAAKPTHDLSCVSQAELERYLSKAEQQFGELHLAGFKTSIRVTLALDDLYVPLDAIVDYGVAGRDVYSSAHEAKVHHDRVGAGRVSGPDAGPDARRAQFPLAEAFVEAGARGKRGLIVLGDPGSGKSTHLKQVLLKIKRDGSESIGLPAGVVPVLLPLRNLRDRTTGLPGFIQQELSDPLLDMPPDFGARMCRQGRTLFLLDGLDEVANAEERAEVARWIEYARQRGTDSWFLVTCRYAGYTRDVALDAGFLELHLRPLNDAQVQRFVTNWYALVEAASSHDQQQARARAEHGAKSLLEVLSRPEYVAVARVYEMTRNPLLLTAICLVHRTHGQLPRARAQLYEESVGALLERWRRAVGGSSALLSQGDAMQVLQSVALWMHGEDGRTRATRDELREPVAQSLAERSGVELNADEFLDAIRDESGLLTGWGVDVFGYMHVGFQEYLAARQLGGLGLERPEVLVSLAKRFQDSWWREVILLLVAHDDPAIFEEFMRAVVRQPEFARWQGSEMMSLCLSRAAHLSTRPFEELLRGHEDGASVVRRLLRRLGDSRRANLEERQVASLEVLAKVMPNALAEWGDELQRHPAAQVREWWEAWRQRQRTSDETIVASQGGVELVKVTGGSFAMGSSHEATAIQLQDFYLARTTVTNRQYRDYLVSTGGPEPAYWADQRFNHDDQPVVGISWHEAQRFCDWAGLQLPTEAQWEYACRANTTTHYHSGDSTADLARVGWYNENSQGWPHPVGEKQANDFGLYDMHGNVYEWCVDPWTRNHEAAGYRDGDGARMGLAEVDYRVIRGGSWYEPDRSVRSSSRSLRHPDDRDSDLGFRPSLVIG